MWRGFTWHNPAFPQIRAGDVPTMHVWPCAHQAGGDTFNFGNPVYAYDDGVDHHSGAVTAAAGMGGAVVVGTYVGASGVVSGVGVKVPVKILPTQIL